MGQDLNLILTTSNELRCAIGVVSVEMSENYPNNWLACDLSKFLLYLSGNLTTLKSINDDHSIITFNHNTVSQAIAYSNIDVIRHFQNFLLVELLGMIFFWVSFAFNFCRYIVTSTEIIAITTPVRTS